MYFIIEGLNLIYFIIMGNFMLICVCDWLMCVIYICYCKCNINMNIIILYIDVYGYINYSCNSISQYIYMNSYLEYMFMHNIKKSK